MSKIVEIRNYFPKAPLKAKKDYAEEFKDNLRKLIAYLKIETNMAYVSEISKKLPDLENELRNMRAVIAQEEAALNRAPPQKQLTRLPQTETHSIPQKSKQEGQEAPKKIEVQGSNELKELQGQISDAVVREKPNIKWDDVAGQWFADRLLDPLYLKLINLNKTDRSIPMVYSRSKID